MNAMLFFENLYEPKTDRRFHRKGGKLKTFHRRYVIILGSVVAVRRSRSEPKMWGSTPL